MGYWEATTDVAHLYPELHPALCSSQQVDYFAFNKAIVKKKKKISLGSSKKKKSSYELENKQKVN